MKSILIGGVALTVVLASLPIVADGTETLGPPGITIAPGTYIVVAGTGLALGQPGTIELVVPPETTVAQVLLYWEGQMTTAVPGDDTVVVDNGIVTEVVTGELIGGPTLFFSEAYSSAFRADVTDLGLIGPGLNALELQGVSFSRVTNGAGVVVILDDGSGTTGLGLVDGVDLAYFNFPEPRKSTVPQTFVFDPLGESRVGLLSMMFSSVAGEVSNRGDVRPTEIRIAVGGETTLVDNVLSSVDGDEWDTIALPVVIPPDAGELTVQAISPDDIGTDPLPASFSWIAAALSIPPVSDAAGCRVTGGGVNTAGEADDLGWDGSMASVTPRGRNSRLENRYEFGGQAGARTALPTLPRGEWTHHQQSGIDGSFSFHAGTSSAPAGTEVQAIVCSDPDNCDPARNAPAKQIDFEGVGTFHNITRRADSTEDVVAGETYHWFEVHIEDLGEPGGRNRRKLDPDTCPPEGRDGLGGELASCDCPDFYRITIYRGVLPEFDQLGRVTNVNKTDVIYEVADYIDAGNLQIHPLTGFDTH